MNTYFLCITQPYNLGDLVINKMLIDELCKYGYVYVDIYRTPSSFGNYLLINENAIDVYCNEKITIKRLNVIGFSRIIKKRNVNLYTTSPGPMGINNNFYIKLAFRIIRWAIRFNKVSFYSIGKCCSMMAYNNEKIGQLHCDKIFLRSKFSVDYVNKKVPNKASYIPDLAFLLRQYVNLQNKEKKVAMTFRDENSEDYFNECMDLVKKCIDIGYSVHLFYQVKTDKVFMERLYNSVKKWNVNMKEDILWFDDLYYYSDKQFVFSNRLHALLIGMVYNAIPVALVKKDKRVVKIEDVFNTVFDKEHKENFYYNHIENNDIIKLFKNTESHKDYIDKVVSFNCSECKKIINDIVRQLQ